MGTQDNTDQIPGSQPTHSGSQPNPSPQASPPQPDTAPQPPASRSGPPPQFGSQANPDGLQDELVKALVQKALREKEAEFARALKEATGFESLQALREHQLKEQGKLKELLQVKEEEASKYRQRFEQMAIRAQIMAAAQEAVDPEVVLTLLQGKAKVDDQGYVTLDGKPPAEAVAELLKEKPYLAKPSGNQGSGSPQQPASANEKTMTREQFEKLNPRDKMSFIQNGGQITD